MNTESKMNNDIQLTTHFRLSEFTRSSTARIHCIDNSLPEIYFNRVYALATILEDVRLSILTPIHITSGYRCPSLNEKVGGVPKSKHTLCLAVDFTFDSFYKNLSRVLSALHKHPVRFIKIYSDKSFIHVDFPLSYLLSFRTNQHKLK